MIHDVHAAIRSLRQAPSFTLVALAVHGLATKLEEVPTFDASRPRFVDD